MSEKRWYKELHWQIAIGLLVALTFSVIVRALVLPPAGSPELMEAALAQMNQIRAPFVFVGDLFIRLLKLIVVPLIVLSVVSGIQSMGDASKLGKVGLRTMIYYMATTFMAVCLGLLVVNIVKPGVGLGLKDPGGETLVPKPILDVFRDIIPPNMFDALASGDMLPIIFLSVIAGLAMLTLGAAVKEVKVLVDQLNAVILKITDWVMVTSPVGVAALFVTTLLDPKLADLPTFFESLGGYMFSVVVGLGIHGFLVLPLMYFVVTRKSPITFLRAMVPALLTAFSTASSSATYPVTRECVTDRAGVPGETADFVLPLGATINMDGTALYEAVAVVFIANALGFELTMGAQVVVVVTATLAAIGAAGVPSAGLVTMIIVLEAVGLPASAYALVVAVDRILDMCRTTINVFGDAIGAAIVAHWIRDT